MTLPTAFPRHPSVAATDTAPPPHPPGATMHHSSAKPAQRRHRQRGAALLWGLAITLLPLPALAGHDLPTLLELARQQHRLVQAADAQAEAATAAIRSARAYPNPEIEYQTGHQRPRLGGPGAAEVKQWGITQPLEWPMLRSARIDAAEAGARAAHAERDRTVASLMAEVKLRYFELLRRQAEAKAAEEDLTLARQIRDRIQIAADQGEIARFELIKADTEFLNAQKHEQAAQLRIRQTRAALRQAVGAGLPTDFQLDGQLPRSGSPLPPQASFLEQVLSRNPALQRAQAESEQAEGLLSVERSRRLPAVALKGSRDQEPDFSTSRLGLTLTIPLWNQNSGPVAEAQSQWQRARHLAEALRFSLTQEVDAAYGQYAIAANQVSTLETGVVHRAGAALKVAEAAWRHGERSLLDYLDAQRVYRAVRNELITARYELAAAQVELDRLRALAEEPQPPASPSVSDSSPAPTQGTPL